YVGRNAGGSARHEVMYAVPRAIWSPAGGTPERKRSGEVTLSFAVSRGCLSVRVSVLRAGSGVEDEGVVDAFFWGAGSGSEGCGEFVFGVSLVAGEVDADVPVFDRSLVAQPQDRGRVGVSV